MNPGAGSVESGVKDRFLSSSFQSRTEPSQEPSVNLDELADCSWRW